METVMPSNLLLKLLARLFPGVGPDDDLPDPNVEGDEPPDDDVDDDGEGQQAAADDDDGQAGDEPPARRPSPRELEIIRLRERAQNAERERDEARRTAAPAGVSPQQRQFEEEEAKLRDPKTSDLEKWQIDSNRRMRANTENAMAALARAEDARDAAAYDRKAMKSPLYDKYRDKVEAIVESERKAGKLVQREQVLMFVIGQAMVQGNFKSKEGGTRGKTTVPRGKPTNARSDVPRRGNASEQDKRRARLENQII